MPNSGGPLLSAEPVAATFTGPDGTYGLYLEPGSYLLGATDDWRRPPAHWWRSAPDPRHADPVTVSADAVAPEVNIVLEIPTTAGKREP